MKTFKELRQESESGYQSRYSRLYRGKSTAGKTAYELMGKSTPADVQSKQSGSAELFGGALKISKKPPAPSTQVASAPVVPPKPDLSAKRERLVQRAQELKQKGKETVAQKAISSPVASAPTKTTSGAGLPSPAQKPSAPVSKKVEPVKSPAPVIKPVSGTGAKPSAHVTKEPVTTLPVVNVTAKKPVEADPNAPGGPGGFVTGYGSSTGRTANIKRGFYDVPGTKTSSGVQSVTPKMMPTQRLPWKK